MRKQIISSTLVTALAVGLGIFSSGCNSRIDESVAEPGTGTIVQNWTIEGSKNASACTAIGATQMRVVLFDGIDAVYATQIEPCETFQLTRVVRAQPYRGMASFFDAAGNPVTIEKDLGDFEVFADSVLTRNLDFSADDLIR